ncbi:MAG: DUF5995 family protein [Gordonia sp. (in: high G+C Gram-positive bacteria)]|uniref:SRPBCC family protein n=1 Tax=Gordonia sp. (in: high G+C Gram-positive bacteria) TaxID=84139 RepID=UPI0039E39339
MSASFTLRRVLDCPPEVAWRLVTDPDQMNRWSTARIDLAEPGPGDRPDTAGALRVVTLPDGKRKLREVVEFAQMPREFRYRVYDGGPLLISHRGVQTFTPVDGNRTELTWHVSMRLVAAPLATVLCRVIRKQVGDSLDLLAGLAAGASFDDPLPTTSPVGTSSTAPTFDGLLADAHESLAAQRALADELAADDDPKQWFARVYQYVTEEMIAAAQDPSALGLEHPDWVLALIPTFHDYYERNLTAYRTGGDVEPAWATAWSTAESSDPKRPHLPVMKGLLYGVSAHIDADLPRALVEVQQEHFPGHDLREFRPDYLRLAPVFTAASDRLLADLPRSHKPWWTPVASKIHPQFRDSMLGRVGYDVGRHRVKTFAKAVAALQDSPAAA